MSDASEDLVSYKVARKDHEWAEDQARLLKRSNGVKVSQAKFFEILRKCYSPETAAKAAPGPGQAERYRKMIDRILEHGTKRDIEIMENVLSALSGQRK